MAQVVAWSSMTSKNSLPILLSLCAIGSVAMMVLSRPVDSVTSVERPAPQAVTAPSPTPAPAPSLRDLADEYALLPFDELYQLPAGPKGLEFTSGTQSLNDQKVRMDGFMVRHFHEDAGVFLFAGVPAVHNQAEYILAESLPTSLVHVLMPEIAGRTPSWRPQRITVYGRLELGSRQEIDGRLSHVRLIAEHVADSKTQEPIELRRPIALQRDRMASGVRTVFRSSQGDTPPTNNLTNTAPSTLR
ncbi:hypothetical protein BGE01nite_41480 [Brevifollis gellanilyticus]|uniref:Uncharacterized protein n=2 Tax=Brevifollis gellanilyticus TaxID=748831 RepID=A0A512MDQ2_9BACT|nr:hypothetical protein BGE01nite_41480 [Brevifollis gellanilyticus]